MSLVLPLCALRQQFDSHRVVVCRLYDMLIESIPPGTGAVGRSVDGRARDVEITVRPMIPEESDTIDRRLHCHSELGKSKTWCLCDDPGLGKNCGGSPWPCRRG